MVFAALLAGALMLLNSVIDHGFGCSAQEAQGVRQG